MRSVDAPLRQMAMNAGTSADIVVDKVSSAGDNIGWDFSKEELVDMLEKGIIDPVKVTKNALRNAASVSSTLLTSNYAIVESTD